MSIPGEKLKWDRPFGPYKKIIAQLVDAMNRIQPIEGIGVDIDQTDHGRQISARGRSTASATSATEHPFQPISTDPFEIRLVPGVIEKIMPTLGSVAILGSDLAVLSAGEGVTKLVLKIDFDYDFDLGRYFITTADINVYDIPDPALTWDDPSLKEAGDVYLKVADVTINSDGAITDTVSYLDDNVRVFAILGKEAFLF